MQEEINKTSRFLLNLRHLVNKTSMKDCEVAEKLQIHKVSFSRYFSDKRIPKRTVLEKMATFFNVPVSDLTDKDLTIDEHKEAEPQINSIPIETANQNRAVAFVLSHEDYQKIEAVAKENNMPIDLFVRDTVLTAANTPKRTKEEEVLAAIENIIKEYPDECSEISRENIKVHGVPTSPNLTYKKITRKAVPTKIEAVEMEATKISLLQALWNKLVHSL